MSVVNLKRALAAVCCTCVVGTFFSNIAVGQETEGGVVGRSFYVSSEEGNDNNAGTTADKPLKTLNKINEIMKDFKPGDKILLKRGSKFNNQSLHIKDISGAENKPITFMDYGDPSKPAPLIAANGVKDSQWHQDYKALIGGSPHKHKGDVSSTILIKDSSYITVKNLEITNDDENVYDPVKTWKWTEKADSDGTKLDRSQNRMDRTGIAGIAENGTTMSNVSIENCYIHDVDGNIYNKHMANGGIYFMAHLPKYRQSSADDAYLQKHVSRFDHISIKNNRVEDVDRWGIAVGYTSYLNYIDNSRNWNNDFDYSNGAGGAIKDSVIAKYGQTNVVIENNFVYGAGGDAITVMYCDRPLVKGNVSSKVAKHINTQDYLTSSGRTAAAIWPWRCKNALFEYNEAYETLNADHGNGDGQPWDADFGDGTLYQYNYSQNNTFATLMVCNYFAINTTFRYNIAVGDNGAIDLPTTYSTAHIYNNTFILRKGVKVLTDRTNGPGLMENNIFASVDENNGSLSNAITKNAQWNRNNRQVYKNNLYINYESTPRSDTKALKADDIRKVFKSNVIGIKDFNKNGKIYSRQGDNNAFANYLLAKGSPAINSGTVIHDLNGFNFEHDFFGSKIVSNPDIGCAESDVKAISIKNIDFETGNENGNKTIYVPIGKKLTTNVCDLLSMIKVGSETKMQVLRSGSVLKPSANVLEGDIVRFSLEGDNSSDSAFIDYVIKPKMTWDWVREYQDDHQGPIWHGQKQDGDSGTWEDLKSKDPQYPNWLFDSYYGPGIDYPNRNYPENRKDIHGLLSDSPGSAGGVAIAWLAPKSGKIRFTIKENEPYLRQKGNNGKAITLSLMINNEVLYSAKLSESLKVSKEFANAVKSHGLLDVKRGDWIRVVATAESDMSRPSLHVSPVFEYVDEASDVHDSECVAKHESEPVNPSTPEPVKPVTPEPVKPVEPVAPASTPANAFVPSSVDGLNSELKGKLTIGAKNVAYANAVNRVIANISNEEFISHLKADGFVYAYAYIYSSPRLLKDASGADRVKVYMLNGKPQFDALFPAGYSGKHTVALIDENGNQLGWTNITVESKVSSNKLPNTDVSKLPNTGVSALLTVFVASILAYAGALLRNSQK